jgi:hypothetical protein
VPGVEPPTVVRVVVLVLPTACAIAGAAAMSNVAMMMMMMMAETAFMSRQREYFSSVPSRDWPLRRASARVALAQRES